MKQKASNVKEYSDSLGKKKTKAISPEVILL